MSSKELHAIIDDLLINGAKTAHKYKYSVLHILFNDTIRNNICYVTNQRKNPLLH